MEKKDSSGMPECAPLSAEEAQAIIGGGAFDPGPAIISLMLQLIPKGIDYFYNMGADEVKAYRKHC